MSEEKKNEATEEVEEEVRKLTEEELDNVTGGNGQTSVPSVSLFPPSSEELCAN